MGRKIRWPAVKGELVDHRYGWENLAGDAGGEYLAQCTAQPRKAKERSPPTAISTQQKQASSLVCAVASRRLMSYRGAKMKIMVVDICCKM